MPQFMLLLYAQEKVGLALPKADMAAWMDKMHAYAQALEKAGAHVSHGALGVDRRRHHRQPRQGRDAASTMARSLRPRSNSAATI